MSILKHILSFCRTNDTTCFVDSLLGVYYGDCSKRHDRRYDNKRITRRQADVLFYRCLRKKLVGLNIFKKIFFAIMFYLFYLSVRAFGWFFYKN